MQTATHQNCPACGHTLASEQRMIVDLYTGIATCGGTWVQLPPGESVVLDALAKAYPAGLKYTALIDLLYADDIDGGPLQADNVLKVHICRIRRALRDAGMPASIETRWTYGYRLKLS